MTNPSKVQLSSLTSAITARAIKQLSKFAACLVGTTAMCLSAYTLTVDSLIQDTLVPSSYKWFLLKDVPGPRIIIESGSNSHHAINTDALGAALGMTAINIADNGGYALEDKVTRLETYARPGDVIVLPLEWTFYHREKLTDNYVDTLFTSNRDYYRAMPTLKRVKRALSLPPEKIIEQISKKKGRAALETESPAQALFISALTQSTGHQSRRNSTGPGLGVAEQSCDDYILGKAAQRKNLTLGANIKPALKRLKALKARGVDIHFAWPVLAGNGCMSDPAYVTGFRAQIEEAINRAGFEFLGTPGQSLYGQDVQDDTPYHITTAGTDIHTAQMTGFLKALGYGTTADPLDVKTFARHRLLELELAQAKPITQPVLPIGQTIAMDNSDLRQHVDFTAGWWAFEPYGRWMRDNRAMLRVTLPEDISENSVLKIQGTTKSGQLERVNVSVNGQLVKSAMFGESAPLLVPVARLPRGIALSIFLSLPDAGIPQSPLECGENEDARSMTLQLQNIELTIPTDETAPMPKALKPILVQIASAPIQTMMTPVSTTFNRPTLAAESCMTTSKIESSGPSSLIFTRGWWNQEVYGRWMKGNEADFQINLPNNPIGPKSDRYTLTVQGDFFMGRIQPISFMIDGEEMGTLEDIGDGTLTASFTLKRPANSVTISLKLSDQTVQSPKALGISADERTLTFFLKGAHLTDA